MLCIVCFYTLSFVGNHTFAAVKAADENYEVLDSALRPVIEEMNELMRVKHVKVKGVDVELEFYLGRDYKVLYSSLHVTVIPIMTFVSYLII